MPRVSNESTTAIQFPGPLDSKNRPGDEGDKNTGTDEDDAIDQAGDIDSGLPECAICLCPFKEHETVCESSNRTCTHQYHPECLEPWLVLHEECPVCREAYLPSQRQLSSRKRWSCGGAPGGRDTARP